MDPDLLGYFGSKGVGTAAIIGAVGWLAAYILNGVREEKNRRLKSSLDHSADQIKNFYAPLVSLTDQLNSLAITQDKILENNQNPSICPMYYKEYFLPVHQEINRIISSNLHLFEGKDIPASFSRYFEHYAAEKAVYDLADRGIDLSGYIDAPPFPEEFYHDVRRGFQDVLNRYDDAIRTTRNGER